MDSYLNFKLKATLVLIVNIAVVIFIFGVLILFEFTYVIAFLIVALLVIVRQLLLGGKLSQRKKAVSPFYDAFEIVDEEPLLQENDGWFKGVGYIEDINQPLWLRPTFDGLIVFFLCLSRRHPILIPWDTIQDVSESTATTNEITPQIELQFKHFGLILKIPWFPEIIKTPMFKQINRN